MAKLYDRKFNSGRQSELLYNEELHKNFEATKHLLDYPETIDETPTAKLDGALWLNRRNNELKSYHKSSGQWKNLFAEKFQITDQIISQTKPSLPVPGQLWIYNDVLCYFTGTQWKPIKAALQDDSMFSMSLFEAFSLTYPLISVGHSVLREDDIDIYKRARREYLQGKIDQLNDASAIGDGSEFKIGESIVGSNPLDISKIDLEAYSQFLVPNLNYDRIFKNGLLDYSYDKVSTICLEYQKKDLVDFTPGLVHIDPSKITKINKRLIKINKTTPRIMVSPINTEYYGYQAGNPLGTLLLPEALPDDGGYILDTGSIILSHNQMHNFDYVLAITYEFTWMNNTGRMRRVDSSTSSASYYVSGYNGPLSIFVEGYDLEPYTYEEDNLSSTVIFKEDVEGYELQALHSNHKEAGFIRKIDLQNRGVIETLKDFKVPMVFLNGEAIVVHDFIDTSIKTSSDDAPNMYYVDGARLNMAWTIIDLYDESYYRDHNGNFTNEDGDPVSERGYFLDLNDDGQWVERIETNDDGSVKSPTETLKKTVYNRFNSQGLVERKTSDGNYAIIVKAPSGIVINEDGTVENALLFVNGILVKPEDLRGDNKTRLIWPIDGLSLGQEYILLDDKYGNFYSSSKLTPAIAVDKLSESLVYLNGHLLCNGTAVTDASAIEDFSDVKSRCVNNEIKFIHHSSDALTTYYKIYSERSDQLEDLDPKDVEDIEAIISSYENATKAISVKIDYDKSKDVLDIFAFNYANDIQHVLEIYNVARDDDYDANTPPTDRLVNFDSNVVTVRTEKSYEPNRGELSVYLNGVRLYPGWSELGGHGAIEECTSTSFKIHLPEEITKGQITYVIERPDNPGETVAEYDILTESVEGSVNLYETDKDLYPGRVTVYIDGIRQPQDSFAIIDNNHILFKNHKTMLIGNSLNYPEEYTGDVYEKNIYDEDGILIHEKYEPKKITHAATDKILVEIRQSMDKHEDHFTLKQTPDNYDIAVDKYDLNLAILDTLDEIQIFFDGLFFGLKRDCGYRIDTNKGTITITDPNVISRLTSDPLYEALLLDEELNQKYLSTHDDQPYKPYAKDVIFEWRI